MQSQIFQRSEYEQELKAKQARVQAYCRQIEKSEPVFGALERVDKRCREQGVSGYRGRFIDYLVYNGKGDSLMPCVDIAAKSKLMAVIVDDLETAKQVLQINKEIKGGVINIFPLETLD